MTGILDLNTTTAGEEAGAGTVSYGFASMESNVRMQRWWLKSNYAAPPGTTLDLVQPSDPTKRWTTLAQFTQAVQRDWKAGDTYIKANVSVLDSIPDSPQPPPYPQPTPPVIPLQLDSGTTGVWNPTNDRYDGAAFTVGGGVQRTEYWVLQGGYSATPTPTVTRQLMAYSTNFADLDAFLTQMRSDWQPGWSFVMASCNRYSTLPNPM